MIVELHILFGFLAAVTWGFSIYLDKVWVLPYTPNNSIVIIFTVLLSALLVSPFIFLERVNILGFYGLFYSFLYGFVYTIALYFYIVALRVEDATVITPILRLAPVFTIIITAVAIQQILTPIEYIGSGIIILCVIILSLSEYDLGVPFRDNSIILAIALAGCSAFLLAFANLLLEISLVYENYYTVFYWSRIGGIIPAIPFFFSSEIRNILKQIILNPKSKKSTSLYITKTIELIGSLFYVVATSFGPVSIVTTLSSLDALFVLIIVVIIGYTKNKHISMNKKQIIIRLLVAIFIFIGVLLISI